jgi:chromosome partitioning protein
MLIAFVNTKGGVGKSTLAVHLAVWLHDQGFRTTVLDTDKQCSSSQWIGEVEPQVAVRVADSPETCLSEARGLAASCDFVVADGPAGLDDLSRTLLILADLAVFPIGPSVLDVRSVRQATEVLRSAQKLNGGRPEGRLVLNKVRRRDTISREVRAAAPALDVRVSDTVIRDLQAFRDAAQQGTVVTRMSGRASSAARDTDHLFRELIHAVPENRLAGPLGDAANG